MRSMWRNSSVLHPGSGTRKWVGERANEVIRFFENNDAAGLTGDNTHLWGTGVSNMISYGINGAHEDTGNELQYVANAMVVQACHEDGMPPSYWVYLGSPAYTFEVDEEQHYYITNESYGQGTSYLVESADGTLRSVAMNGFQAMQNDSAAWLIDFDPVTAHYHFRNVATGHYITAPNSSLSKALSAVKVDPSALAEQQEIQLMRSRTDCSLGKGTRATTHRGYWIAPNPDDFGGCMVGQQDGTIIDDYQDLADGCSAQRWIILSSDEMDQVAVNSLEGTLQSIVINGESVPGVLNEYTEFTYQVAPGTSISDVQVEASVKSDYAGTTQVMMPDAIPGTIEVQALRNGKADETYTVNVEENLLYNWNARNTKGVTPLEYGWVIKGNVTADVVNGADSTFHFVDADAAAHAGYLTNTGKDFPSNRLLEMPFMDNETSYEYHFQGLQAGRQYKLYYQFCQLWKEGTTQVSLTTNVLAADGTALSADKRTYAQSVVQKMKKVNQEILIPEGTDVSDIVVTFNIKQSCRHILSVAEMSVTDEGEYVVDAIEDVQSEEQSPAILYNLQGMRLQSAPRRGIYISNGRKILVR